MVVYEPMEGTDLVRAYSNIGLKLINPDGVVYDEAIDPVSMNRTYEEYDDSVDPETADEEVTPEEIIEALEGIL